MNVGIDLRDLAASRGKDNKNAGVIMTKIKDEVLKEMEEKYTLGGWELGDYVTDSEKFIDITLQKVGKILDKENGTKPVVDNITQVVSWEIIRNRIKKELGLK